MKHASKFVLGVVCGLLIGMSMGVTIDIVVAQVPGSTTTALPTATVPDWVIKYAANQEQAYRQCSVSMAQEQDKVEKLTKELADAKAALAKAKPVEEKK